MIHTYNDECFIQNDNISCTQWFHNGSSPTHKHSFIEIAYVESGFGFNILNEKEFPISKNDIFIIDRGSSHSIKGNVKIVNCIFKPHFIDSLFDKESGFIDILSHYLIKCDVSYLTENPLTTVFHDEYGNIFEIFRQIENALNLQDPFFLETARGYLILLITSLMKNLYKQNALTQKYGNVTDYIIKYVDENYNYDLSLNMIADELGYSVPYLCKKFKADTGCIFTNYLQKIRIENAKKILANTCSETSDICETVGYRDEKYFSKLFKLHTGMSPKKFRQYYVKMNRPL